MILSLFLDLTCSKSRSFAMPQAELCLLFLLRQVNDDGTNR